MYIPAECPIHSSHELRKSSQVKKHEPRSIICSLSRETHVPLYLCTMGRLSGADQIHVLITSIRFQVVLFPCCRVL